MYENKSLNKNDTELILALSKTTNNFDKYIILLKNDFGYSLTKSELADVIKKSEQTIDRRIKEGINIPNYHRSGEGNKASYIFPVIDVAYYLANSIKVQ